MNIIELLGLIGMFVGIAAGVWFGEHVGVTGMIVGGLLGSLVGVSAVQALLMLLVWLLTQSSRQHQPSPSNTTALEHQKEVKKDAPAKPRKVKPLWIFPIAAGMFTVVGLIGTAIYRDFSILWNCLLLLLATLAILVVGMFGMFILASLLWVSALLAMPANWVLSKLAAKIESGKKTE
jgi:MFS family permease